MPSIDLLKASRNPQKVGSFIERSNEKDDPKASKASIERTPQVQVPNKY